jgi:NAD(P)H dehydrogenase (quinone)
LGRYDGRRQFNAVTAPTRGPTSLTGVQKMAIVVTGTTGPFGRKVVEHLLARGVEPGEILATARRPEALGDLAERGIRTARLDYDDVDPAVLSAGDVVLLVSGNEFGRREAQHGNVVKAAAAAGVERIVYTSAPSADDTTLAVAPEHAATERLIRDSGVPFTFLRNGWYTENYLSTFEQARGTGVVVGSAGNGAVASAPREEFAEAAAAVLATDDHEGAIYELTGDEAWTYADLAATFGDVLGTEVVYRSMAPEEHREVLQGAGLDEGTAGFVVALDQNIAEGLLAVRTGELSKLIGRPTTTMPVTVASWVN